MGSIEVAVAAWCCGCAVTASTCPSGTKLVGAHRSEGRAEWCATTASTQEAIPTLGRTYASSLEIARPVAMTGTAGPFTSWYANGALESHGRYDAESTPEGLWAFWYPDGRRRVLGVYHRGQPIGCFAAWDADGTRNTGIVDGERLHVEPCTPPGDTELAIVEGRVQAPADDPAWAEVTVQAFAGPNRIGASSADQLDRDPAMTLAFAATARARLGRLRVGPTFGVRVGDTTGALALSGGVSVAWQLPTFHPRIETTIGAELGLQRIEVTAARSTQPGIASLAFWSPLPAVQADLAIALSPSLAVVASLRVDGTPRFDVARDVTYCDSIGCYAPAHETWRVGGFAYGAALGLRLSIR